MIPKIIHYCWFGRGEMPELAIKCIESWKKFCPDYEIMVWNEENFDISSNRYVKEAYESKKFAFVTDYVRLYAMYNYGGIYMDTDVMVLKSLDEYLVHHAFSGFESKTKIPTGIMASEKGYEVMADLLKFYDDAVFIKEDGTYNIITNTETITAMFTEWGFMPTGEYQEIKGMAFYPQNIFCPDHKKLTNNNYMKDTATIHYFAGSWKSDATLKRERSAWWKAIAVVATGVSRVMTKLLGDKWTIAKNKVRDNVIESEKNK